MKKCLLFAVFLFIGIFIFAENRVALLIANSNYRNFSSLAGPSKEAEDLSQTLKILGFDVQLLENGTREQMLDVIDKIKDRING
jgi:uncharacterized caspase-like protein